MPSEEARAKEREAKLDRKELAKDPHFSDRVPRASRLGSPCSFTFKYLPNIIREFCTHVAVGDACALRASGSYVKNFLCSLSTDSRYAGVWWGHRGMVCGRRST